MASTGQRPRRLPNLLKHDAVANKTVSEELWSGSPVYPRQSVECGAGRDRYHVTDT